MKPLVFIALLLGLSSMGCVQIGLGNPVVIDEAELETNRVQVLAKRVVAAIDQDDTALTITADRVCDIAEQSKVRQTVERDRINMSPAVTWQLGIYGTILAGVGAGVLIDAQLNVLDDDPTGRDYNEVGPDVATGIGVGFLTASAPLLIIAAIDGFRAVGSEGDVIETTTDKRVVERNAKCQTRVPAARTAVFGRTQKGTKLFIGNTDAEGILDIDLAGAIPENVTLKERARVLALFIEGHRIGNASLKPVAELHAKAKRDREDTAWDALDLPACQDEGDPAACGAIEGFLRKHPDSQRAPAARTAVKKGREKRRQREAAERQREQAAAAAAAKAAAEQRQKAERARVCQQGCAAGCSGNQQCVNACVAAKCR